MSGPSLGEAVLHLIGDDSQLKKTTSNAKANVDGAFKAIFGVSMTAAGGIALVGKVLKDSIDAALDAEVAQAATAATIKATGREAKSTSELVDQLSASEMYLTGVDDEAVRSGINVLLTFGSLGNNILPRVTSAAMDFAAAQAQGNLANLDITSSAQTLGMALNTFDGYTRLQRQIGKLTPEQEATIKNFAATNDLLGYQQYILGLVEGKFSGMAEAMGGTNLGKIQKAKTAISELEETLGTILIPILGDAAVAFELLITWNDRLYQALANHGSAVAKTSSTYEEYVAEMNRAAKEAKAYYDEEGNLVQRTIIGTKAWINEKSGIIKANALLSESEWETARATEATTAASEGQILTLEQQKAAEEAAQAALDAMTKSNQDYLSQLGNWQQMEADLVTARKQGYSETGTKIKELIGKIGEEEQAIADVQAAHDKETKAVILGYMEQILAADGLTQAEVDALITQGIEWGIYDETMKTTFDNAIALAGNLADEINGIPTNKYSDIWLTTHERTIGWGRRGGGGGGGGTGDVDRPLASGGDFIVPPGYLDDSFLMGLTSGEHVSVETPAQQAANGGSDGRTVIHQYFAPVIIESDKTQAQELKARRY